MCYRTSCPPCKYSPAASAAWGALSSRSLVASALCAALLVLAAADRASAAIVTVTSNYLRVYASDGSGSGASASDTSTVLNRTNTITATDGDSYSKTTLDWTADDDYAVLDFTFDQQRARRSSSFAQTEALSVNFAVAENTTYVLSGEYGRTGTQSIYSDIYLIDSTANTTVLFRDYSSSRNTTPNESFTLGVANDGDYNNQTFGSLTGILAAGHQYRLLFYNSIDALNADNATAPLTTAEGFLRLQIGDVPESSPVPEPATLGIWGGLALGGLLVARRRKAAGGIVGPRLRRGLRYGGLSIASYRLHTG